VAIGACALATSTSGSNNVAIGPLVNVPITTGSCQLAIGYADNQCWLTGCSNKAIRPGAGIMDCTGSTGTVGQVLTSNGANALQWAAPGSGSKQYMSAITSVNQDGFCLNCNVCVWNQVAASGISITNGTCFSLTAGKTYLFNAGLQWYSSSSATVNATVALVNASTITAVTPHRMYLLPLTYSGANSQAQLNLSTIYTAPTNMNVMLRAVGSAGGSFQIAATNSYMTITEL
jgi:hypothetical protein